MAMRRSALFDRDLGNLTIEQVLCYDAPMDEDQFMTLNVHPAPESA